MKHSILSLALAFGLGSIIPSLAQDALPSWNDGPTKQAIVNFVAKVTKAGSPDFVRLAERIATFGNSDGDRQMLEWTQAGGGARLMMLVHHDDAEREFSYGAESRIGTFSDALMAEAMKNGWAVISMKKDWKTVFPGHN